MCEDIVFGKARSIFGESTVKAALVAIVLWTTRVWGQGGGADIVFVYDNSGSMWSQYAKIDTNTGDTAFYQASGCSPGGLVGTPFAYPTLIGPRTIQWIDSTANCYGRAGDPYVARIAVISQAVDYLAARSPNSTAGAVAFAHDTAFAQPPLPLSAPGNAVLVKSTLGLDSIPNTNYVPPLRLATAWLQDSSLARNARQAIVFISDGEPNDAAAFTRWLSANTSIPIFAIGLGDSSSAPFVRMQEMSALTGGSYYRVFPQDVPRMNQVMGDILGRLTAVVVMPRPAHGPRARIGASRPAVDAAGRSVSAAAVPGIRFAPSR